MDEHKPAENITIIRKTLNISQEQLSLKTGLARQTISKWENNKAVPTLSSIKLIAKALGVSTSTILSEKDLNLTKVMEEVKKENKRDLYIEDETKEKNLTSEKIKGVYHKRKTKTSKKSDEYAKRLNDEILKEAKKHFAPYLYPVKVHVKKSKIFHNIKRTSAIILIILLILYLVTFIYKIIILSALISKIDELNKITNYYIEVTEYENNFIKEKDKIWTKDGIYRIDRIGFDDFEIENEKNQIFLNTNENYQYKIDLNTGDKVKKTLGDSEKPLNYIADNEYYNYIYTYLPNGYKSFYKSKLKNALSINIRVYLTVNGEIKLKSNKDEIWFRKNGELKTYYWNSKGENTLIEFRTIFNVVNDEDVKIVN